MISPIFSLTAEVILAIGYGYEVQGRNDRKVESARQVVQLASETVLPGALLVNNLPFRAWSYLPWRTLQSGLEGSL
jgi:hypothetical protein